MPNGSDGLLGPDEDVDDSDKVLLELAFNVEFTCPAVVLNQFSAMLELVKASITSTTVVCWKAGIQSNFS